MTEHDTTTDQTSPSTDGTAHPSDCRTCGGSGRLTADYGSKSYWECPDCENTWRTPRGDAPLPTSGGQRGIDR